MVEQDFKRLRGALDVASELPSATVFERLGTLVRLFSDEAAAHPQTLTLVLRELIDPTDMGRTLLGNFLVPLVDSVETLCRDPEENAFAEGFPIRDVLVGIIATEMLRSATRDNPMHLFELRVPEPAVILELLAGVAKGEG